MTAEHDLLLRAEAWARDHRHLIATRLEEAMSHLTDLIDNGRKLAAERAALIADRDAHKARADKAEAHAADLQSRIDADDKTAADAADELAAEVAKEAGLDSVAGGSGAATEGQAPAPVTTTSPSGAIVTVAATTTTHEATDGTTTVLDHATGAATATDAAGQPVPVDPTAVTEAQQAHASVSPALAS